MNIGKGSLSVERRESTFCESFLNSHLIYAANLCSFLQLKVEKKSMAPRHIGLVQNTRMNLPRFIEYMNARTRK